MKQLSEIQSGFSCSSYGRDDRLQHFSDRLLMLSYVLIMAFSRG